MSQGNSQISAVVLTKNEEPRIKECLKSLNWADEIIVVDNGSTDQTREIAQTLGAQVLSIKEKSFAKLRDFGKEKAKYPWVLYIDADEIVPEKLQREIKGLVKNYNPQTDPAAYFLQRRNFYLGRPWPITDRMQRLFWKKALVGWQGDLHETAEVKGEFGILKEPLIHNTHRTLEEMVAKTNEWSAIEAKLRLEANHPPVVWWRLMRVMVTGFTTSFFSQGGWKAGTRGWIESIYQAFSMFITYAKLWELQNKYQK